MRSFVNQTTHLRSIVELAATDPERLALMLQQAPFAAVAQNVSVPPYRPSTAANPLPLVVTHGMGDSCFNPGMKSVTQASGNRLGVYATCIPTADHWITDTIDGFLKSMDKSVDTFAAKVRADPKLANGFDAFGLSQGNNVIRGYITKYNNPPVRNFMSICGINAGVGALPMCSPQLPVVGVLCEAVTEVLGELAYNPLSQGVLFQADYYRDPARVNASAYLRNSELAQWNNEGNINEAYKQNWAKVQKFVWVKGTKDTVVWPREGEWWGAMSDLPGEEFKVVHTMKDTRWYKEDLFGLRTADEAGKNFFESFDGQHIRMTEAELFSWLDKYFN